MSDPALRLPDTLDSTARTTVLKNGTLVGTRRALDLIEGSNSTLTIADDSINEKVTVTVASSGASGTAGGDLTGTYPNPTIATSAVTSAKIADGTIVAADIASATLTQALMASGYRLTYAGTSAPGSPLEGDQWYDTTNNLLNVYNGTVWYTTTPVSALVATSGTTTSNSFTGTLSGSSTGPTVTVLVGTSALVTLSATIVINTAGVQVGYMGFTVGSPSSLAAATTRSLQYEMQAIGEGSLQASRTVYVTGLTAASQAFTAQYQSAAGGTVGFANRTITVIGLP